MTKRSVRTSWPRAKYFLVQPPLDQSINTKYEKRFVSSPVRYFIISSAPFLRKNSESTSCKTYWFEYGNQEWTSFKENEYGEIRKENVENEDFYTIVKIPLLRHKGFWTTSILLPRQSNHDAVERTPSKNWAFERILEALRCFDLSPKKELLFEIRNRCVLIRSLNPDLIVLLRKELF